MFNTKTPSTSRRSTPTLRDRVAAGRRKPTCCACGSSTPRKDRSRSSAERDPQLAVVDLTSAADPQARAHEWMRRPATQSTSPPATSWLPALFRIGEHRWWWYSVSTTWPSTATASPSCCGGSPRSTARWPPATAAAHSDRSAPCWRRAVLPRIEKCRRTKFWHDQLADWPDAVSLARRIQRTARGSAGRPVSCPAARCVAGSGRRAEPHCVDGRAGRRVQRVPAPVTGSRDVVLGAGDGPAGSPCGCRNGGQRAAAAAASPQHREASSSPVAGNPAAAQAPALPGRGPAPPAAGRRRRPYCSAP